MNEIALVSVITSCVWIFAAVVIGAYWRLKNIIDCNYNTCCNMHCDLSNNLDKRMEEIEGSISAEVDIIGRTIDDVYRHIDSRVDKLQAKVINKE